MTENTTRLSLAELVFLCKFTDTEVSTESAKYTEDGKPLAISTVSNYTTGKAVKGRSDNLEIICKVLQQKMPELTFKEVSLSFFESQRRNELNPKE